MSLKVNQAVVTLDDIATSDLGIRFFQVEVFAPTEDAVVGDGARNFVIPQEFAGFNIVSVKGKVITAGNTGTLDFQLRNVTAAADILSTEGTIDSGELSTNTAATPLVIDTDEDDVAADDTIAVDINAVQSVTVSKGLILTIGVQAT